MRSFSMSNKNIHKILYSDLHHIILGLLQQENLWITFQTMSLGHYLIAKEKEILLEVQLDEIAFINFSEESKNMCLATTNLNSCHVVLVVSQSAALMAHIAPGPPYNSFHLDAGDHHIEAMMSSFCTKYRRNRHLFPINATWIGTGIWEEEVALPYQEAAIQGLLRAAGLYPSTFHYQITPARHSTAAGRGLVFVDGRPARRGLAPPVYFEHRLLTGTRLPSPEGEILAGHTLVRATRATEDRASGYRVQLNGQRLFFRDHNWQVRRVLDVISLRVAFGLMIMPEDW